MKTFFYNLGYFFAEVKKTVRLNLLSNLFSIIGTGLILFLLGMVAVGWSVGDELIHMLSEEAEVSAYFDENIDTVTANNLVNTIKSIGGVRNARLINAEEARERMKETLGEEARILELFNDNPFEAFIEVRIDLASMDSVLQKVGNLEGISYVRDNREVLTQLKDLMEGIRLVGYLIILAVGITTLIIISHMIRQGIYNNKDQINTLRLLGAPDCFIGFPFVLTGLLLTLLGGVLTVILLFPLIHEGYSQLGGSLPFLPLPAKDRLIHNLEVLILSVSAGLGLIGSLFGLSSIKKMDGKG